MKKTLFASFFVFAALLTAAELPLNTNFANKAKGWRVISGQCVMVSNPDGTLTISISPKYPKATYADFCTVATYPMNADEIYTVTVAAKGTGRIAIGVTSSATGNLMGSFAVTPEYKNYTWKIDMSKVKAKGKLPSKMVVKFLVTDKGKATLKSIKCDVAKIKK